MHIITSYQLIEIRDQVAVISAHGDITGDSSPGNIDGYDYTADLKGH